VTAHALLSFAFNLMLLALAINLAASAIGNLRLMKRELAS